MITLTNENYYSPEANQAYMSATWFKKFSSCEAAALAEVRGEYAPAASTAMLTGSYVDAYFSGELPVFQAQHPEIFKQDGSLKAEFVHAQDVIARMESDELYMLLMSGKKQVILTGEIAGVPFKVKIDSLLDAEASRRIAEQFPETAEVMGMCDGAVVDQKVMRDMANVWSDEERAKVPFAQFYGYDIQGAIYQAIEGHMLPFILAVGTKEDAPDIGALYIPDAELAAKLAEVEDRAPRYQAIKEGRIAPRRCGKCAYCRMTKKLRGIVDYREVGEC